MTLAFAVSEICSNKLICWQQEAGNQDALQIPNSLESGCVLELTPIPVVGFFFFPCFEIIPKLIIPAGDLSSLHSHLESCWQWWLQHGALLDPEPTQGFELIPVAQLPSQLEIFILKV